MSIVPALWILLAWLPRCSKRLQTGETGIVLEFAELLALLGDGTGAGDPPRAAAV